MWEHHRVSDVLRSLPSGDVAVLAGEPGLARHVRTVQVVKEQDELRRVRHSDLVVTSASLLHEAEPRAERLLGRLDAAGIAGIVVLADRDQRRWPRLLGAADQLALPVLALPGSTPIWEAAATILAGVLDTQRERVERVMAMHQRFTRIVVSGGGPTELLATLHELLGRTVALVDTDQRPVAVVPSDAELDLEAPEVVRQPIRAGDVDYGELIADVASEELDEDAHVALERASMGIAVRMAQASAVAEAQERFASITLEELISGHATDVEDVVQRARSFGWDLHRPRAVLLASIDPSPEGPVDTAALTTIAAAARATLGSDAIVWSRSSTIAALLAPTTAAASERRRIAEELRRELDHRVRSVTVSIGVGRRVDRAAQLSASFTEAKRSVDVGRWAKGRHVTEVFDELGLERLLVSSPTEDLGEFVSHAIGALIAHDEAHRTDLVETMATWLETRNMAEAARRIHVHYNTLKNRLDRIEEILGPVLTDAGRALECEVAIYIHRHHASS
jgi:purine catabolism regulator